MACVTARTYIRPVIGAPTAVPSTSTSPPSTLRASDSQRGAIEAPLGPMLVLAGPGAGKTFCLIERIRFLIETTGIEPSRICAFTFTNKAAEEIASRLDRELGNAGTRVRRGTVHAFCADLLRTHGSLVRLERGFGIADDNYQRGLLGRLGVSARRHGYVLKAFSNHRLRGADLDERYTRTLDKYLATLARRNLVDFDGLVIKARDLLLQHPPIAESTRQRWDYVLVDEFQDLNKMQYEIIRELAREHRNLFAVGDDEQSIFSWTGADPRLFSQMLNDFEIAGTERLHYLIENHRCPREPFDLARRLVRLNTPLLPGGRDIVATREAGIPVETRTFADHAAESTWLLGDLLDDQRTSQLGWGQYAVLYRKHEIGDALEASLVSAGIPCQLAHGRALADDPVVAYVIAALRVIASPQDILEREQFLKVVLPPTLSARLQGRANELGTTFWKLARSEANLRKRHDPVKRKLRQARTALDNLDALGRKHTSLRSLIEELLSQRIMGHRTILEERHEELLDPAHDPDVVALADRLQSARDEDRPVWIAPMAGVGLALKPLVSEVGLSRVVVGGPTPAAAVVIDGLSTPTLGPALGTFKALQLLVTRDLDTTFRDYTAVDLEATDRHPEHALITDLAAVRVRGGRIVDTFSTFVQPGVPIPPEVSALTGITDAMVASAPTFEQVWPNFRAFCGADVLVAHNGHHYDFAVLRRLSKGLLGGEDRLSTYDSLLLARELHSSGCRLADLAHRYGVSTDRVHRALDDSVTLVRVLEGLEEDRVARDRKTALVNLFDHLGAALALSDEASLGEEAIKLREVARFWTLGNYSDAIDRYREEHTALADPAIPSADDLIERLGGRELMLRVRTTKNADQRYPAAMARLRRLLERCEDGTLADQITMLLELLALSRHDGASVDRDRVNLLTLHSTKGLEFSRVYIVGVEDAEMPGNSLTSQPTVSEVEESRRLLYVGMTRTKDRLVMTHTAMRNGRQSGGHQFFTEMGITPDG